MPTCIPDRRAAGDAARHELLRNAQDPVTQAHTWMGLAEVHRLAGRSDEARAAIETAVRLYDAKGNTVAARTARDRLAQLAAASAPAAHVAAARPADE